jgi:hypothetical protein
MPTVPTFAPATKPDQSRLTAMRSSESLVHPIGASLLLLIQEISLDYRTDAKTVFTKGVLCTRLQLTLSAGEVDGSPEEFSVFLPLGFTLAVTW